MRNRCYSHSDAAYLHYGGRGIKLCDAWREHFPSFLADMGEPPSEDHTIERIDVNGHYEPNNCRWATKKEQCWNRRNTIWVENGGVRMSLGQACYEMGLNTKVIRHRMKKGLSFDEAAAFGPSKGKGKRLIPTPTPWEDAGMSRSAWDNRRKAGTLHLFGAPPEPKIKLSDQDKRQIIEVCKTNYGVKGFRLRLCKKYGFSLAYLKTRILSDKPWRDTSPLHHMETGS